MSYQKHSIQVVVAHFKENLDWIKDLQKFCIVYDKGDDVIFHFDHVVKLRNFGRECDTILTNIIDSYPIFCDYTVFIQGNISDHVKSVDGFKEMIINISEGKDETSPGRYSGINSHRCSGGWGKVVNFKDSSHGNLPIKEIYDMLYDTPPPDNQWKVNYCSCFMVSREALLFHSKKFYETMYDYMQTHEPSCGYCYERYWCYIFDYEIKGKPEIEDAPTSERKIASGEQDIPTPIETPHKKSESDDDSDSDHIILSTKTAHFAHNTLQTVPKIAENKQHVSEISEDQKTFLENTIRWVSNGRYTRRVFN